MMTKFTQLYPSGLIRYTQSTFLELVTDTEVHRIDFRGKLSSRLRRGTRGPVSFHHDHPLLKGVHGPLASLMARATPYPLLSAPALLADIRQELQTQAGEWYSFVSGSWTMWWQRLVAHNVQPSLTRTGGIILDSVPVEVAQSVADICATHGVETYYYPPQDRWSTHAGNPMYHLLLIGRDYIIAREFFVSTLC
ncbi:hypothetical protein F0P96_11080 [Hymenobacter busanensis]|uniref:Uncharacterized protein n=1 Tax=Hymenobacter busanensis TaxID=2607656 RepID=A0A7L4ZXT6_9BACT|nr:hypothetical protein [Hymenobacter busanensis]KAA9332028.1 hypothetical protein F0P96_11080 [Hymenobacter busanensis]QHJ07635.1 hypothetical protein GUY19_10195 [Hymenobacter busanensis]